MEAHAQSGVPGHLLGLRDKDSQIKVTALGTGTTTCTNTSLPSS